MSVQAARYQSCRVFHDASSAFSSHAVALQYDASSRAEKHQSVFWPNTALSYAKEVIEFQLNT